MTRDNGGFPERNSLNSKSACVIFQCKKIRRLINIDFAKYNALCVVKRKIIASSNIIYIICELKSKYCNAHLSKD